MKTSKLSLSSVFLVVATLIFAATVTSCGTSQKTALAQNNSGEKNDLLRGKIVLKNKQAIEGYVYIPGGESKSTSVAKYGEDAYTEYKWEEIEYMEAWSANSPDRKYKFVPTYFYSNKMFSTKMELQKQKRWFVVTAESPTLTSYISALKYGITKQGEIILTGIAQQGGRPSFSIYMKKAGGDAPYFVSLKGGIATEAAYFRGSVTRFLADDPDLCEYINEKKLGTDNIEEIVKRYNPKK